MISMNFPPMTPQKTAAPQGAEFSLPTDKSAGKGAAEVSQVASACLAPGSQADAPHAIPIGPFTDYWIGQAGRANTASGNTPESLVLSHGTNDTQPIRDLEGMITRLLGQIVTDDATVALIEPNPGMYRLRHLQNLADTLGVILILATHRGTGATIMEPGGEPRFDRSAVVDDGNAHSSCRSRPSIRFGN